MHFDFPRVARFRGVAIATTMTAILSSLVAMVSFTAACAGGGGGEASERLDRLDRVSGHEPREVRIREPVAHDGADLPQPAAHDAPGSHGDGQNVADLATSSSDGQAPSEGASGGRGASGPGGSGASGGGNSGSTGGTDGSGSTGNGDAGSSGGGGSGGSGTSGGGDGSSPGGSGGSGGSGSSSGDGSGSGDSGSSGGGSESSGGSSGSSESGGDGSAIGVETFRHLAARESPDFDAHGFPVRRGEVIAIDASDSQIRRAGSLGFEVIEDTHLKALRVRMVRLRSPAGETANEAVARLWAEDTGPAYELDHYFTVNGGPAPSDSIAAPPSTRSVKPGVWIGMIDTTVLQHPAFGSLRVERQDLIQSKPDHGLAPWHGTAVASILARNGVSRLSSVNVFSADAQPFASVDNIARALDWLVGRNVPVINISIAGPRNALLDRVIAATVARGVAVVAAAGNGGPTASPAYPAASPGAIAVTAVDAAGRVYLHANRGPYITIAAQGVDVPAAAPGGTFRLYSGTSFAAPVVAAYLGRCIGKQGPARVRLCVSHMEHTARRLGPPGRDPIYGFGLLTP